MTKNGDEQAVSRCLALIESKLGWGNNEKWANYDFEKLSEEINDATGVRLSVTTLKRIWGKLKYDSAPTLTTLNTLAQFAGFADWRTFKQTESNISAKEEVVEQIPILFSVPKTSKPKFRYYWLSMIIPLSFIGYLLIPSKGKTMSEVADSKFFTFRADKIQTEGVPNSVVFHYDAKAAKTDSVFIVQTWDTRRKKLLSKVKHAHSAIYYYPGFFRTKLIADNEVVKTHDLWITSDGWLSLVEGEPMPLYFKKEDTVKNGVVEVNEAVLKKYNLSLHPKAPPIRVFNQRDMGDLKSDNFIFETYIKNDFNQGSNACQPMEVLIQCKDDIIIIPLAAKACVGDLFIAFCGTYVNSKDADLSKFGADLSEWTKLRVVTVNKKATIFVNDIMAYSLNFPHDPTGIVGVQYRFNGTGAVKGTWFQGGGEVVRF
ncbi:hypothetical protein [Dyadobacter sp. CY323]|uniref:hypothetical protein n=1 Tax=Dyadobacter sp. CY323 TaxID=2907302 RepID=UPI001F2D6A76|nr:hypothetical protein [Dyadobacter sp. CY323]MCE6993036.1 hypothetical protein [Dyadobacter sp. CY323]